MLESPTGLELPMRERDFGSMDKLKQILLSILSRRKNIEQLHGSARLIWLGVSQIRGNCWHSYLWFEFALSGFRCCPLAQESQKGFLSD